MFLYDSVELNSGLGVTIIFQILNIAKDGTKQHKHNIYFV